MGTDDAQQLPPRHFCVLFMPILEYLRRSTIVARPSLAIAQYLAVHRPHGVGVSKSKKLGMAAKMPQTAPTTSPISILLSQPKTPRSAAASRPSSRSTTPIPRSFDKPANDHTISFRPRLSQKEHPPDCPPLRVRWFYAVDVCFLIPLEGRRAKLVLLTAPQLFGEFSIFRFPKAQHFLQ